MVDKWGKSRLDQGECGGEDCKGTLAQLPPFSDCLDLSILWSVNQAVPQVENGAFLYYHDEHEWARDSINIQTREDTEHFRNCKHSENQQLGTLIVRSWYVNE